MCAWDVYLNNLAEAIKEMKYSRLRQNLPLSDHSLTVVSVACAECGRSGRLCTGSRLTAGLRDSTPARWAHLRRRGPSRRVVERCVGLALAGLGGLSTSGSDGGCWRRSGERWRCDLIQWEAPVADDQLLTGQFIAIHRPLRAARTPAFVADEKWVFQRGFDRHLFHHIQALLTLGCHTQYNCDAHRGPIEFHWLTASSTTAYGLNHSCPVRPYAL